LFIGIGLAATTAALTASPAVAETPGITLSVTPDSLALAPGETARVLVAASLPLTTTQAITLSAFTAADLAIDIANPTRDRPAQGDVAWAVTLTRTGPGSRAGKVYFQAETQALEDGARLPGVTTATLDVQERIPKPIDQVISASLETNLDSIQDRQTRQAFVVVKNISSVPVTVTQLTAWPIPGITPTTQDVGAGYRLEPQQSRPFTLTVTAGESVQTGKQLLVVQVDAAWLMDGQRTTGSLVLNQEFQVGVFGESAILQATGIPSLMLLPGFLFLITLVLTVKWTWKKTLLELDFKKPEFWYIAVTLSLLTVWLYPALTGPFLSWLLGRPMTSHDLLQSYGFSDILLLWLGAVLIGLLAWAIGSTVLFIAIQVRQAQAAARADQERQRRLMLVPVAGDDPIVTLRKIANNQKGLDLREVRYTQDKKEQLVFELPSGYPEAGLTWVAPRIRLTWRKDDDKAKDKFEDLTGNTEDIRPLLHQLEAWQDPTDPLIELDWDKSGALIKAPEKVAENQVGDVPPTGDTFFLPG
jgi:hypothetical protein